MRHLVVVAGFGVLFSLDAFPGACCASTTTVTSHAWEECGAHGPRYIMNCESGLTCYEVTNASSSRVCSAPCASDADCRALGPDFTCNATGRAYTGSGPQQQTICGRASR
jgi:hypothetical protein